MQQNTLSEEQQRYISEIFLWRSRFLFGLILRDILSNTGISHRNWGKRALAFDKELKRKKFRYAKSKSGYLGQVGIHRMITAESPPTYMQVYTFLKLLQEEIGEELPKKLITELWHLALFGSPEEVIVAYEKHKHLIDESSPEFIKAHEEHKRKMEEE